MVHFSSSAVGGFFSLLLIMSISSWTDVVARCVSSGSGSRGHGLSVLLSQIVAQALQDEDNNEQHDEHFQHFDHHHHHHDRKYHDDGGDTNNNNNHHGLHIGPIQSVIQRSRSSDHQKLSESSATVSSTSSWLDAYEPPDHMQQHTIQSVLDSSSSDSTNHILDSLQLNPLLQVPCGLSLARQDDEDSGTTTSSKGSIPVPTFVDTGAQRTVMSWEAAERIGFLLVHLDRRYGGGTATGIGSCTVIGRIPAGVTNLHFTGIDGNVVHIPSPPITILESTGTKGVDLLLGLDFLREHQAVLNLRDEHMDLIITTKPTRNSITESQEQSEQHHEVSIPFLRLKSSPPLDAGRTTNNAVEDDEVNMPTNVRSFNEQLYSSRGMIDVSNNSGEEEGEGEGEDDQHGLDMSGI